MHRESPILFVIAMGAASLITGLAIYKPTQVHLDNNTPWRLRMGALGAFLAHHRLLSFLSGPRVAGNPRRMEQFPRYGEWVTKFGLSMSLLLKPRGAAGDESTMRRRLLF